MLEEKKLKKVIDIREEYFKLTSRLNLDDYDMVPIPKPPDDAIPPSPGEMESLLLKATEATLQPSPKQPFQHQYA
ncbi:hypothetical protein HMI54_002100 [Coelomomyces lativittatus]|nr:hypothetical protein HMI54_002100 [Coelomomyces lativittatus]KAJ1512610.1 hypothetical protein HMI56_003826 [Coelomomyces lativittatus]